MEESYNEIEALIRGELNEQEAKALMVKIDSDEDLKATYLAYKASHAAFEYQIAEDTRGFVKDLIEKESLEKDNRPKLKVLYIAAIAATILVLICSVIAVNFSHNDNALADLYNINSMRIRDGKSLNNINLSDAIQAYYQNDFAQASAFLNEGNFETSLEQEYKSWLELMILFKTEGSESDSFQSLLQQILADENHEFNKQAQNLDKDLHFFWRKFVVKK